MLYPINSTHDTIEMFEAKQCSNDCNQMLGGKHIREENHFPHAVK